VGPRAVLDTVVKRKIPNPRRESNPRTPVQSGKLPNSESQPSYMLFILQDKCNLSLLENTGGYKQYESPSLHFTLLGWLSS
jgi:hypothetical protein